MSEQYLKLEGANIYYEVQGTGPYLILVPGANGDADIFKPLRAQLIDHFTVVLYDRRGFSRSVLTGPQDYNKRIDTDVDDIYRLMKSLTSDRFAIMGNSSGAIVTLKYLVTHPDTLAQCILHEPPLLSIMPNKEEHCAFQYKLYDIATKEGKQAAMIQFAAKYSNEFDGKLMMASQASVNDQRAKNADYWFEHELRQYPTVEFDFEQVKQYHAKLILINGELNKDVFIYQPNALLAKYVGVDCFEIPGGHLGFLTHSEEFAKQLIERLKSAHYIA